MADSKVERRVNKFISVFHGYICQVDNIDFGPDAKRYPKILYFSLLEALSKTRFPKKRASAAFSSFLVNHCEWLNGDKFSLPHIVAALERTSDPDFKQLRDYAFPKIKTWGAGGPREIDCDPDKPTIQTMWPKDEKGEFRCIPELSISFKDLQHRNLLYAYRSKLSHESRAPTVSFEHFSDQRPFYESVSSMKGRYTSWNLVYPTGFLRASCHTGLESLKRWLFTETKDPYLQFMFGRFLIDCVFR